MNKTNKKYIHSELTSSILEAYYKVYNKIGYGLTKKIYTKAILLELKNLKLDYEYNKKITIYYDCSEIGEFESDIVVKNLIIIHINTADEINFSNVEQLKSILKSSIYEVGLLLNFGREPGHKRKVFTNDIKTTIPKQTKN